ncbi:MAG: hypothetical protein M3004_02985 [Bacteroidota bacterium]|nr:hypothetical protein [Bacteroidota bacterium]
MALNLVETIQKNLGFHELQKIDPNTQEVKKTENLPSEDYLPQAAIPTVLLGLYKFSGDKEGNKAILNQKFQGTLLSTIFGKYESNIISKVSEYTGATIEYTSRKMEEIAGEAVRLIKENVPGDGSDISVKEFLIDQKNNILLYLPAELQIGKAIHDDTIDDRSHKMEGPVSTSMHWLEKFFPSTDRTKEENF